MGKGSCLLNFKKFVTFLTSKRRNISFQLHFPLATQWATFSHGVATKRRVSSEQQKNNMGPIVPRWLCQIFLSFSKRGQQLPFLFSRYERMLRVRVRKIYLVLFLKKKNILNYLLYFLNSSGVLCGAVVSGRVLVLQCFYTVHVGCF